MVQPLGNILFIWETVPKRFSLKGYFKKPLKHLFIWLCWVIVATLKIFHCGMSAFLGVAPGLSCPVACGVLVPLGTELGSPALESGFLTTGLPGKSPNNSTSDNISKIGCGYGLHILKKGHSPFISLSYIIYKELANIKIILHLFLLFHTTYTNL